MQNTSDQVHCSRCGAWILPSTANRFRGKCARCGKQKWYEPARAAMELTAFVFMWPAILIAFLVMSFCQFAAQFVPGTRENLTSRLAAGWKPEWQTVRYFWSTARRVYDGPVGFAGEITPEFMLVEYMANHRTISSQVLFDAISTQNAVLSAYCVLALGYRRETAILRSLPEELLQCPTPLSHQVGCFVVDTTLGDFLQGAVGASDGLNAVFTRI